MNGKAKLAIVGGVAALVAVLAVYSLVAGMQGTIKGISVNEEKRGKGTVDTLEFKNPVTIRLIDKNGNVASETVVYNDITDEGKAYIYQVLGNPAASIAALNRIGFFDATGPTTSAFRDPDGSTTVAVQNDTETCTPSASTTEAKCVATFTFVGSGYQPNQDGNLTLNTGVSIQTGYYDAVANTFTPYFNLTSMTVPVDDNTTYTSIQITWTITVS